MPALEEARRELDRFYRALERHPGAAAGAMPETVLDALCDDLNTPLALARMRALADAALAGDADAASGLRAAGTLLGLAQADPAEWFRGGADDGAEIERADRRPRRSAQGARFRARRCDPPRVGSAGRGAGGWAGGHHLAPRRMTGRELGADIAPIGNSPVVILVRPQLADNIGAVARAMANGGLFHLRLVAPRDGWPQEKAWRNSSGADRILDALTLHDSVADAVADLHRVFATCPRPRHIIKPVLTARGAAAELRECCGRDLRCGVLFGPERAGLDNDDMARTRCADPLSAQSRLHVAQSRAGGDGDGL